MGHIFIFFATTSTNLKIIHNVVNLENSRVESDSDLKVNSSMKVYPGGVILFIKDPFSLINIQKQLEKLRCGNVITDYNIYR
jgi:hypothetical protein